MATNHATRLPTVPNRWLVCVPDPMERGSYTLLKGDFDNEAEARKLRDSLVNAGSSVQIYHTRVIMEHISWTPAYPKAESALRTAPE